jgi:hypothetical protein
MAQVERHTIAHLDGTSGKASRGKVYMYRLAKEPKKS